MKKILAVAALALTLAAGTASVASAEASRSASRRKPIRPSGRRMRRATGPAGKSSIINAICAEAKLDCVLTPIPWDGLIPALTTKKIDAIMNSMSITAEREKTIAFSDKYYNTPTAVIGAKDETFEATPEGLKGKIIGVQVSTTHSAYAKKHFTEAAEIKEYQTQDEANQDLAAGRIDATQADSIALDAFLKSDTGQGMLRPEGHGGAGHRGAWTRRRRWPAQGRHGAEGQDQRRDQGHPRQRQVCRDHQEVLRFRHLRRRVAGELRTCPTQGGRITRRPACQPSPSSSQPGTTLTDLLASLFGNSALGLLSLEPPGWGATLLRGLVNSLEIAFGAFGMGALIGISGAYGKLYGGPVVRDLLEVYTTIVRAVPELVLILLLYFAGTDLINRVLTLLGYAPVDINGLVAGIFVLGIVQGAYSTEVLRGAILSIPQGQIEAARAYGMSPGLLLRRVTLPAMLPFAIPGLANLWLIATKDTALLAVVGFSELTQATRQAAGATKAYFTFFMAAGALYLCVTLLSNVVIARAERWSRRGMPAVGGGA